MGRGSSKTTNDKNKGRRFYTFTLNENKPEDKALIDFLELRSTTATVKTALKQLMEKENGANTASPNINPADLMQAIAMLSNVSGTDVANLLKKENSEPEQAATSEDKKEVVPEERKGVVSVAKNQALAGLDNAF